MQKIYLLTYPLVNLYPKSSCVTLSFLQVDELASLQVYELLLILYANLRSFIWLFGKQLVHLSSCSLVHLFFFKYMFSCYFVSFLQAAVLLSTLLPYHKKKPWREAKVSAVRTGLELDSVTPCITTIFIGLIHLCSQIVATIEYFEST